MNYELRAMCDLTTHICVISRDTNNTVNILPIQKFHCFRFFVGDFKQCAWRTKYFLLRGYSIKWMDLVIVQMPLWRSRSY